jgi:lysozyme
MSAPTNLREQLIRDEGYRPTPYQDSQGLWTVGIGFCLERRKLSLRAAEFILDEVLSETTAEVLGRWPWMRILDEPRRGAFVNMGYNLGVAGLAKFEKMLKAAEAGDWETAAREGLASKWARQVGIRAERLMTQLRTGEWN